MKFEVVYSEEVEKKIKQFEDLLESYEQDLRIYLIKKYSELYKTYPQAANAHISEDFGYDHGIKMIKWEIQKIKDLSIPEGIFYEF